MKTAHMLLIVAALLAFAAPEPAAAQGCTTKCTCWSDGCGCQTSGGNGGECNASGNGCFVKSCTSGGGADPDHLPVGFADVAAPQYAQSEGAKGQAAARKLAGPARWERTSPGVFVLRDCTGEVTARRYDAMAAAVVRKREAELVI